MGKTGGSKLPRGEIGTISEFNGEKVDFTVKFEDLRFQIRILKDQLKVVDLEIHGLDVFCDVQSGGFIQMLIKESQKTKNVTKFLRGMAQWEEERIKYREVVQDVREGLQVVCESFDGDTFVIKGGQNVSIFPGKFPGGSPVVFLNGCDVSSFVDVFKGKEIVEFVLNTISS